jgi:predicted  nucleic acid-binding Zn-ribbon protein
MDTDVNARVDYFRSEIEGKLEKLRKDFDERAKSLETQLAAAQQKIDGAVRELRRI